MTDKSFDDIAELLPAYVNSTLSGTQRAQVDLALAASADLREELEEVRAIAAMVKAGPATDLSSNDVDVRLTRLLAQTDAIQQGETPVSLLTAAKSALATPLGESMIDKSLDEYEDWLPAYVNGTLDRQQSHELEAALAHSQPLRVELDATRAFAALVKAGVRDDLAPADVDTRLARLMAQTADMPQERTRAVERPSMWQTFTGWLTAPSLRPAYAMALIAVVAIQGGILTQVLNQPKPDYGSLSGPEKPVPVKPQLIIQFSDTVTVKDLNALLVGERLRIIGGPVEGVYEVAPSGPALSASELEACITRLRASPRVIFVDKAA
jgi:anti-sigma factor RsiW